MAQAVHVLLNGATTTVTGDACVPGDRLAKVVEATVTGTGAVTATVEIYGNTRKNNTDGILLATITLNGTAPQRDGFAFDAPWPVVYALVAAISGTSAAVTVDMAV